MSTSYTKPTGSSGTMKIVDLNPGGASGNVEFWLNSNNSTTYNHDLPWGYTINGVTDNTNTFDYSAGDGWQRLGVWNVTTSQTVTFRLYDTGTTGFGGPTTFNQAISRATVPAAPSTPTFNTVQPTSLNVLWTPNSNGGAAITNYEIAYGPTTTPTIFVTSTTSPKAITGLTPGTTYYFKVRAQNSVGWSAYSTQSSVMTIAGVRVKVAGVWKIAVPYVKVAGVWKLARPYVRVGGVWKETI